MRWRIILYVELFIVMIIMGSVLVLADWPPAQEYYRPLIGGVSIEIWYNDQYIPAPIYVWTCTLGYVAVDSNGNKGYVTAGHCFDGTTGGPDWWWVVYQPTFYSGYPDWGYAGSPNFVQGNGDDIDTGFVPINNVHYEILTIDPKTGNIDMATVYDYIKWTEIKKDQLVYKTGQTTGVTIGHIVKKVRVLYLADFPYKYAVIANYTSDYGDSGGPVYMKPEWRKPDPFSPPMLITYLISRHSGKYYDSSYGMWLRISVSVHGIEMEADIVPMTFAG